MKNLIYLILFFFLASCTSSVDKQKDFYKQIKFLNYKSDSLTIKGAVNELEKGNFSEPVKNKVFHVLQNKPASWLHFKISKQSEHLYFVIWGAFLEYGKLYTYQNGKINELKTLTLNDSKNYDSQYRFPVWKLKNVNHTTDVFLKIKDTKRITSLKMLLLTPDEFISYAQKDSIITGTIFAFLLTLLIALILLFIAKKQYSLIWYAIYILVFGFDYLVYLGIDVQLNIFSTPTQHSSKRILLQSLGAFFALVFYTKFYPYTKKTMYVKRIFLFAQIVYGVSSLIAISIFLVDSVYLPKIFLWLPQRLTMFLIPLAHFILIKDKTLPVYLGVAFLLPLLFAFRFLYTNPTLDGSLNYYFLIENIFYFSIIIEMCFVVYYIISQLVKSEFLAINLQKENLQLRNSLQDDILTVQQQERNKLLNNVHDTFGGYLEALKIRLLQKQENTQEKVQEILDSFYKEYRYLLNSLYAPKINSTNFVDNLVEFCTKLNAVSEHKIKHQFLLKNTSLPPEKCVHIYRIISELTTNAIKYSKASEIKVSLSEKENNILLIVTDNGVGFDVNTVKTTSYGLKSVNERIISLNAHLDINSNNNLGTTFTITIPNS